MRRLALCAVPLLLPAPASAAGPQVTDPAGDANAAGVVAPVSLAPYDITSVRWWADGDAQHVTLTFAEAPGDGRFIVTFATPTCDAVRLEWRVGSPWSYLAGCKPRQRRWPAVPARGARTLTFSIPRADLPTWVAQGTTLRKLGATAAPVVEVRTGQLHPEVDTAYADVRYVVGS